MTLVLSTDNSDVSNSVDITDSPAVRIVGDDIRFTNSGRLKSASFGQPAISIEGSGAEIFNLAGGIIEPNLPGSLSHAIDGSETRDVIINEGDIRGAIDLGGGNDEVVHRGNSQISTLFLGAGDDLFRLETAADFPHDVRGGDGFDTYVVAARPPASSAYLIRGVVSGMERLEVLAGDNVTNLDRFGGFQEIVLETGGDYNFIDSANPDVDLALDGAWLTLADSSVRSITGGDGTEVVTLRGTTDPAVANVSGDVDLGAGTDRVQLICASDSGGAPWVEGQVAAGAGEDSLAIYGMGDRTIDLAGFTGFEILEASAFFADEGVRLENAAGLSEIRVVIDRLVLASSDLPDALVRLTAHTDVTIEATVTINRVASISDLSLARLGALTTANDAYSVSVTNSGTVLGNVGFYIGNDTYDGRTGSTGGTVYGFAGDDTLLGGTQADRLDGGYGNDVIEGGAGSDRLNGGAGVDRLAGGSDNDSYWVDSSDLVVENAGEGLDTVYAATSFALGAGVSVETLATADYRLTDRLDLTGNEFNNAIIGSDGINLLRGGGGGDTLRGLAGIDTLDGGDGVDQMFGGTENDSYYVTIGDRVFENAGEGFDRVYAQETFALTAGSEVEVLATADYRITTRLDLTGNEYNNAITGSNGVNVLRGLDGSDTLRGLAGTDTLDGGNGVDQMFGGTENDNYYVTSGDRVFENAGEGFDSVYAHESFTLNAGSEVELLATADYRLTTAVDLTGNELANSVTGNNGANGLGGLGGNDTLRGLAGNDTLDGGSGRDILFGGDGDDRFAFTSALGGDNVDYLADFDAAHDRIALDDARFAGLGLGTLSASAFQTGSAAAEADDRIIYDQATGRLWFDADGSGAGAQLLFATVAAGTNLTAADFVVV